MQLARSPYDVNLYCDTQTQPSQGMRQAMADAEVGDEQRAGPDRHALQERVAELLGHEAALFLPSGTMCNEIAIRLHIRPGGDEVLLERTAHPIVAEAGGPAALSGAMMQPIDGDGGMFTADQLEARCARPATATSRARGSCRSSRRRTSAAAACGRSSRSARCSRGRAHGLRAHLDGARLMNAVVASGVPAADYAAGFDTAWVDFTKGLGAPVGACSPASRGADRGGVALQADAGRRDAPGRASSPPAGLYALDHNVERLAEDHANARLLAEGLAEIAGVDDRPRAVETNIVIFEVDDAPGVGAALRTTACRSRVRPEALRAVTHLDVDRGDIDKALSIMREVIGIAEG